MLIHSQSSDSQAPEPIHFSNPEEVWSHLLDGNALYTSGHFGGYLLSLANGISTKRKESLKDGQQPHAIIVCCSDSRAPPELIFNQGLGHIFVVR